jgi:hypothetical protein
MNLTSKDSSARSAQARQIKAWAREVFALPAEASVLVSELTCTEPGCPPLETVIAVLSGPGQSTQYKVHEPMADVSREDLEELAAHLSSSWSHHH